MAEDQQLKVLNEGQFKPGWKGGPGRPKKLVTSALRKFGTRTRSFKNPFTGEIELMTEIEIAAIAALQKAQKGNILAFMEIADRLEGKVEQGVKIEEKRLIVAKVVGIPGVNMNLPPDYSQRKIDDK